MAYQRPAGKPSTTSGSPTTSQAPAAPAPTQGAATGGMSVGKTKRKKPEMRPGEKANPFTIAAFMGSSTLVNVVRRAVVAEGVERPDLEPVATLQLIAGRGGDGAWLATAKDAPESERYSISAKPFVSGKQHISKTPIAYMKGPNGLIVSLFKQVREDGSGQYLKGTDRPPLESATDEVKQAWRSRQPEGAELGMVYFVFIEEPAAAQ